MTLSGRLLECITSESVAEILNDSALGGSSIPIMSKWLADASVKITTSTLKLNRQNN
jgi:hypothetical protein